MKPRIFSGIKPSGDLHIGNYIGAIQQWTKLQDDYDNFFCVVDHHAITMQQDPELLRQRSLEIAKLYLACGIDPGKSTIFIQSHVPAHTELSWILSTMTKIPEMERMTQFKDKSSKAPKNVNIGLFTYPILMAADILLYNTNLVPVGEDQTQHLEFARTISRRFNKTYKTELLITPEQFSPPKGARIMSLQNPTEKMSKSENKPTATLYLMDEPDAIKQKIKKAVTDSGDKIVYADTKPALKNLLEIYSAFSGQSIKKIVDTYETSRYRLFKEALTQVVIDGLAPIQKKYKELDNDPSMIHALLQNSADKANLITSATLRNIKELIGYTML